KRREAEEDETEGKHRTRRRRRSGFDAGEWPLAKYSLVFILGFTLLCAWYWLQTSRLSSPLAHPAWAEAGLSLGERLTGAVSMEPVAGLTLLMKIMSYGGIFIMALYFGRDRHRARLMFISIALVSGLYAAYGLAEHFSGVRMVLWFPKTEYPQSVTSTFINRNSYATFAGIGVLAALGPILHEIRRLTIGKLTPLRLMQAMSEEGTAVFYLLLVSIVLNLSALVLTGSRAGFASAAFGLFVFLVMILALRDIGVRHFISLLILSISIVFAFVALGGSNLIDRMSNEGREARVDLFDVGRLAASEHPLTGQGLASFSPAFNRANDGAAIFPSSWVDFAHNSYLELVVEGGMIGLIGSLALIGLMIGLMLQGVFTRARGTSFVVTGIACAALVGAHAMVDFSIQMPAVAATFLLLVGAASGQALPSSRTSDRAERARIEAEEAEDERQRAREDAERRSRRKKRRRRERKPDGVPSELPAEPAMARAAAPAMPEELRRLSGELSDPATTAATAQPEKRQRSSRSSRRAAAPAVQAFGTDYASALERWRELRAAAAPNSETLVNDAPTEPHPDDHALIEQRYIRTGDSAPPQPAFDPSLSQPPMPTAWPGAADTTTSAEPVDSGLPPPDPEKPSATIYELPRRGRDRT
ncbi:MAG TPA: O-antigen ligase family protein, partial [Reyranellaceae bacterium]|nr:O-antigen ligase family protein [Reyranellaceae bacterium]